MDFVEGVVALPLFLIAGLLLVCAVFLRSIREVVSWGVEALTRHGETEREKLSQLAKIAAGGAPDALTTRIAELETGLQGQKMLVADAVERVTSLSNRISARQRRSSAVDDLDEPDEPGPTPEQQAALANLLRGTGAIPAEPAPAAGTGGQSLKERAKQHRAQGR